MTRADWIKAGIDLVQAIVSGATIAFLVYWLDKMRAKRDRRFEYFRIASSWSSKKEKTSLRGFDLEKANLAGNSFKQADLESVILINSELESVDMFGANLRGANLNMQI